MTANFQRRLDRAANAIAGKSGEQRREAISAFLRTAMVALLVG
jgi:hypothetical protein